jgi:hypothetical protein
MSTGATVSETTVSETKASAMHASSTGADHITDDEHSQSRAKTTLHTTLHCLAGCAIGELLGLMIGVSLGLGAWLTMGLATALALLIGLNLAVLPLVRAHGRSYLDALRVIWLGEIVSILAMEVAMNGADYAVGGVQSASLADPLFWIGFAVALPAGFLAAYPINWWLIGRNLKHCH